MKEGRKGGRKSLWLNATSWQGWHTEPAGGPSQPWASMMPFLTCASCPQVGLPQGPAPQAHVSRRVPAMAAASGFPATTYLMFPLHLLLSLVQSFFRLFPFLSFFPCYRRLGSFLMGLVQVEGAMEEASNSWSLGAVWRSIPGTEPSLVSSWGRMAGVWAGLSLRSFHGCKYLRNDGSKLTSTRKRLSPNPSLLSLCLYLLLPLPERVLAALF